MTSSVRRLVAMFESPVAARPTTRAPEAISRTRVAALVQFYGASSTIASTAIEAIDAVRFAAFPNLHDPAAAAVEPIDPRWSIQVIDSARFAEFGYPLAVATDSTSASANPSSTTTTTSATASAADAGTDAAAYQYNNNDEPAAIHEPEQTQPAQPAVAAADKEQHAPNFDDTKKTFAAEPVKLQVEQILPPNEPRKNDHNQRVVPGKLPCITPRACQPIYAAAPRIQSIKSRLFDFERNPAFNRQRAKAKQRRAAAAAPSKTPIWKL